MVLYNMYARYKIMPVLHRELVAMCWQFPGYFWLGLPVYSIVYSNNWRSGVVDLGNCDIQLHGWKELYVTNHLGRILCLHCIVMKAIIIGRVCKFY